MRKKGRHLLFSLVRLVSTLYWPLALLLGRVRGDGIRVLGYHSVCTDRDAFGDWSIPVSSFALQMAYLRQENYEVLSVDEAIARMKDGRKVPKKAVCITFDDGYRNNFTLALPELARHGYTATFYVATAFTEQPVPFPWLARSAKRGNGAATGPSPDIPLTWSDIHDMADRGMLFGSHSHTHADPAALSPRALRDEIDGSMQILSQRLSGVSRTFVSPFGITRARNDIKAHLADHGYTGAFLGRFGTANPSSDPFDLPRITIYGGDSLAVFRQKLAGAYDWIAPFHIFWRLYGRRLSPKQ